MLQISALQLAELLAGIGRAQAAMVQGLENELAGVRSGRVIPAVQGVAHLRGHPEPTLVDLPVRVFLASMGRVGPEPATIARELERLISGKVTAAATKEQAAAAFSSAPAAAAPPVAAAAAPAAAPAAPAADGGDAMDFTKPA